MHKLAATRVFQKLRTFIFHVKQKFNENFGQDIEIDAIDKKKRNTGEHGTDLSLVPVILKS